MTDRSEWIEAAMAAYRLAVATDLRDELLRHDAVPFAFATRIEAAVGSVLRKGGLLLVKINRWVPDAGTSVRPPWQEPHKRGRDWDLCVEVRLDAGLHQLEFMVVWVPNVTRGGKPDVRATYYVDLPEDGI